MQAHDMDHGTRPSNTLWYETLTLIRASAASRRSTHTRLLVGSAYSQFSHARHARMPHESGGTSNVNTAKAGLLALEHLRERLRAGRRSHGRRVSLDLRLAVMHRRRRLGQAEGLSCSGWARCPGLTARLPRHRLRPHV